MFFKTEPSEGTKKKKALRSEKYGNRNDKLNKSVRNKFSGNLPENRAKDKALEN